MLNRYSRAPKLLGDFGEGLVAYTLILKGFEVASVDHVGADLIAERDSRRIAVSVKTRLFRAGSTETQGAVVEFDHLDKLEFFAKRFALEPVYAHVASIVDASVIHMFMISAANVRRHPDRAQNGFRLRFGESHLQSTIDQPFVDYSCWRNESICESCEKLQLQSLPL